jgi:hypothetical protein
MLEVVVAVDQILGLVDLLPDLLAGVGLLLVLQT